MGSQAGYDWDLFLLNASTGMVFSSLLVFSLFVPSFIFSLASSLLSFVLESVCVCVCASERRRRTSEDKTKRERWRYCLQTNKQTNKKQNPIILFSYLVNISDLVLVRIREIISAVMCCVVLCCVRLCVVVLYPKQNRIVNLIKKVDDDEISAQGKRKKNASLGKSERRKKKTTMTKNEKRESELAKTRIYACDFHSWCSVLLFICLFF